MKTKVNDLSAKDYSIGDYLKESKKFLIPRYQRSYAWEKKNIMQLLEDVSKEEGYYIGNIIVNTLQNDEKEMTATYYKYFFDFDCTLSCYRKGHTKICTRK